MMAQCRGLLFLCLQEECIKRVQLREFNCWCIGQYKRNKRLLGKIMMTSMLDSLIFSFENLVDKVVFQGGNDDKNCNFGFSA